MAALPAGSSGLLNSLQKQNKSSLDAKLNHTDSCARREPGITAFTVHRQTVQASVLEKSVCRAKSLLSVYLFIYSVKFCASKKRGFICTLSLILKSHVVSQRFSKNTKVSIVDVPLKDGNFLYI